MSCVPAESIILDFGQPVEGELLNQPVWRSRLTVCKDFVITFTYPRPCAWWRLWQRALLGWRWERLYKKGEGVKHGREA